MTDKIDLNQLAQIERQKTSVKIEPAESKPELCVRLFKDVVTFIIGACILVFMLVFCYDTMNAVPPNPEAQKWAMSVYSTLFGGVLGFIMKR